MTFLAAILDTVVQYFCEVNVHQSFLEYNGAGSLSFWLPKFTPTIGEKKEMHQCKKGKKMLSATDL